MIPSVTPGQVAGLVAQGHALIDVRSSMEFSGGHPPGATNVPLAEFDASGAMAFNPDFVDVMAAHYPKDQPLLLGCRSGTRSAQACQLLLQSGWQQLHNIHADLGDPGWHAMPSPVPSRSYADLRQSDT